MSLQVELTTKQDILVIRLMGELDHHTADSLRQQVDMRIQQDQIKHILLNLEDLSFMDSSGIGVIIGRYKQITSRGGRMVVCSIHPSIYRLFELSGLFKILQATDSEEQALEALGVAS